MYACFGTTKALNKLIILIVPRQQRMSVIMFQSVKEWAWIVMLPHPTHRQSTMSPAQFLPSSGGSWSGSQVYWFNTMLQCVIFC